MTAGQLFNDLAKVKTEQEATAYFESYVQKQIEFDPALTKEDAVRIATSNIGYVSRYGSDETYERIKSLFKCAHPVFG